MVSFKGKGGVRNIDTVSYPPKHGQITESYPESTNPYRIIPLIIKSYPYTKSHPNIGYDSVICPILPR